MQESETSVFDSSFMIYEPSFLDAWTAMPGGF
jgi:hypothetical protein